MFFAKFSPSSVSKKLLYLGLRIAMPVEILVRACVNDHSNRRYRKSSIISK